MYIYIPVTCICEKKPLTGEKRSLFAKRDPYWRKETLVREKRPLYVKRDPYSQRRRELYIGKETLLKKNDIFR